MVGDKVWLFSVNFKLSCPTGKLGPKCIGPFEIKREVNPVALKLALPNSYKIHPVFLCSSRLYPAHFPREKSCLHLQSWWEVKQNLKWKPFCMVGKEVGKFNTSSSGRGTPQKIILGNLQATYMLKAPRLLLEGGGHCQY